MQQENDIATDLAGMLDVDEGMVIEGVGDRILAAYPSFTIEMETGTGKTYVYLRTIYELRKHYGFSKFIVVVPSIAIYEGVIKNFKITQRPLPRPLRKRDRQSDRVRRRPLSQLRGFATSTFVEILVITLDSFNKTSNVIFKPSEKLPGERLPYRVHPGDPPDPDPGRAAEHGVGKGARSLAHPAPAVCPALHCHPPHQAPTWSTA